MDFETQEVFKLSFDWHIEKMQEFQTYEEENTR